MQSLVRRFNRRKSYRIWFRLGLLVMAVTMSVAEANETDSAFQDGRLQLRSEPAGDRSSTLVIMEFTPLFTGTGTVFFYPLNDCQLIIDSPVEDTLGGDAGGSAMLEIRCTEGEEHYIEWEVRTLEDAPCEVEGLVTLDSLQLNHELHRVTSTELIREMGVRLIPVIRSNLRIR